MLDFVGVPKRMMLYERFPPWSKVWRCWTLLRMSSRRKLAIGIYVFISWRDVDGILSSLWFTNGKTYFQAWNKYVHLILYFTNLDFPEVYRNPVAPFPSHTEVEAFNCFNILAKKKTSQSIPGRRRISWQSPKFWTITTFWWDSLTKPHFGVASAEVTIIPRIDQPPSCHCTKISHLPCDTRITLIRSGGNYERAWWDLDKPTISGRLSLFLVGGWTNPFEKY